MYTVEDVIIGSTPTDEPLLYTVEFDDGEHHNDIREEEIEKLRYQPKPMPEKIQEPLTFEQAMSGPKAIKVGDRLRLWWEEDQAYEGTVTELESLLGRDCKPTISFRVAYDDGDDQRHVLGDFPLEKLTKDTKRPEPLRHTRVTPKELSGKRTRGDAGFVPTAAEEVKAARRSSAEEVKAARRSS